MRIDARLVNSFSRIGGDRLAVYLGFALLIFLLSFFFLDTSKQRNNIFYLFLAAPAFLFAMPDVIGVVRTVLGRLLILHFAFLVLAKVIAGNEFVGVLKHALYIVLMFACLSACYRSPAAFNRPAAIYLAFVIGAVCWSVLGWAEHYLATGRFIRMALGAAASNPVHAGLMLLTGWLGFWVVFALPYLAQRGKRLYVVGFISMLSVAFLICVVFQARSALLGMMASLVVLLIVGRKRILNLLITLFLVIAVLLLNGYEALLVRGGSYRVDIWQDALATWYNSCSLWFGCAEGAGIPYLGKFHHAHSAYVSILVDYGFAGALSFIVFTAFYCWKGFWARSPWFVVSMVGWAGVLVSSNGLVTSPRPLWVYFWIPTLLAMLDIVRFEIKSRGGHEKSCTIS